MPKGKRVKATVDGREIEWELHDGTLWVYWDGKANGVDQCLMTLEGLRIEMVEVETDGVRDEPEEMVLFDDAVLRLV